VALKGMCGRCYLNLKNFMHFVKFLRNLGYGAGLWCYYFLCRGFSRGLVCDLLQRLSMHLLQMMINYFVVFHSSTNEIRRHGDRNIME